MISTVFEVNEIQERSTDVRAYISPSRLNTWLRCPLAFKLRYIDGIRSPPSKCERRLKTLAPGRLKRLAPDVVLLL